MEDTRLGSEGLSGFLWLRAGRSVRPTGLMSNRTTILSAQGGKLLKVCRREHDPDKLIQ